MNTPLSLCHASLGATQYSAACQTHIRCTLNCGRRQAGREGDREGVRKVGGWERARGGWEQGNTREGARGGREEGRKR